MYTYILCIKLIVKQKRFHNRTESKDNDTNAQLIIMLFSNYRILKKYVYLLIFAHSNKLDILIHM